MQLEFGVEKDDPSKAGACGGGRTADGRTGPRPYKSACIRRDGERDRNDANTEIHDSNPFGSALNHK